MTRPRRLRVAARCSTVVGAWILVLLSGAAALGHAPGAVIQLGAEIARPGDVIVVSGSGMYPDEVVTFELGDATRALPIGSASASGEGDVAAHLAIPPGVAVGEWEIYARGSDGDAVSARIIIRGAPAPPADEGAPDRGAQSFPDPGASPAEMTVSTSDAPSARAAVPTAPIATFGPRTLPPVRQEASVAAPGSESTATPDPTIGILSAGGGFVVAGLLALALVVRLRRRGAPAP